MSRVEPAFATAPAAFERAIFFGVLLVALLARLVVLWWFAPLLSEDRDAYLSLARRLADGQGYVQPDGLTPTAFRPPLYPLVLAPALRVAPERLTVAMVNLLAGLVTVLAVMSLARRTGSCGPWTTALAGLIVAVDPLLLHNTALPMTEVFAAGLLAVWFRQVVVNRTCEGWVSARGAFVEGCLWGLGALCRPVFLPLGLLATLWPTLTERTADRRAWRRRVGWAICGAAGVLAPWIIRNGVVLGQPLVTTTHGGYTLLLGHNTVYYKDVVNAPPGAVWKGDSLDEWQQSLEARMARAGVSPSDELARDRWFTATARQVIRDDPWLAIRSGGTLLGRFWSIAPANVAHRPLPRAVVWGIAVGNVLVFLGATMGLVRAWRQRHPVAEIALIAVLVFSAVHFVYWSDQRMRAPLVPVLACLAAMGVSQVWGRRGG
jgi:hypothetical protein